MARTMYPDLEAAMAALPIAVEHRAVVRDVVAGLPRQRVWIPDAESYIALADTAAGCVAAYVNRGFADVRTADGGHARTWLGDAGPRTASPGRTASVGAQGPPCPACWTVPATNGVCGC